MDNAHECDACRDGIDAMLDAQRLMMKKHGWYYHYVVGSPVVNIHTHGFVETFGHADLQIVAPLGAELAGDILHAAAHLVKEERTLEHNDYVAGVIRTYDVKIVRAKDGERPVLRIILPDKEGHLERFDLLEPFDLQYMDLELAAD